MSKAYRDWVRAQPCCVSRGQGSNDPHHIKGYGWITGSGWALKATDLTCIPLQHELHVELHDIGWRSFEDKHNICQLEQMVLTMLKAEREGVIEINHEVIKKCLQQM